MGFFEKFADYYDLVYRNIVNYEKECDVLEKVFSEFFKTKPKSILDVGCGTGSHALILAKRGFEVAGIDISKLMIEKARAKAEKQRLDATFHFQDMQKLRLDRKFDCAICMFGALGFVYKYRGLAATLSRLRQHLNKDGLVIFEFWNVGGVRPSPYQRWMEAKDNRVTVYRLSETNFDHLTNVITLDMKFIVVRQNKLTEAFKETYRIRCYTLAEIQQYLENNGFKLLSAYDWDAEDKENLKKPRRETFGILAVARKS